MKLHTFLSLKRHFASRNLLNLSERHGMISNFFPREQGHEIAAFLEKECRTIYAGFDPTAQSLHVGNLLVIMGLLHAQKAGHRSLALIGGATARIGDPSGKNSERQSLSSDTIQNNTTGIKKNLKHIFKHFKKMHNIEAPEIEIINNEDWYKNWNFVDFLSEYGKHFRLSKMLAKESVKKRLEDVHKRADPDGGMSFLEFNYQVLQAYDWLHLSEKHNCLIQLGGHDQMGNISAGHDFIKRVTGKTAYGLLLPLVTTESGQKLGKSEGNAVWLSPDLTSSFDFYQYFVRIPDAQVEQMLNYFTFMPANEIKDLIKVGQKYPEKREPQIRLASEVTQLVHGLKGLEIAEKTTQILYNKSDQDVLKALRTLSKNDMQHIFQSAKYVRTIYQPGLTILDLAMKLNVFKSEKNAQKIIESGGFYVNQCRRTNIDELIIAGDHILSNDMSLIRIGKKNYIIIDWYQ